METKDKKLNIRITEKEHELLKKIAEREKRSLSDLARLWIRKLIKKGEL